MLHFERVKFTLYRKTSLTKGGIRSLGGSSNQKLQMECLAICVNSWAKEFISLGSRDVLERTPPEGNHTRGGNNHERSPPPYNPSIFSMTCVLSEFISVLLQPTVIVSLSPKQRACASVVKASLHQLNFSFPTTMKHLSTKSQNIRTFLTLC